MLFRSLRADADAPFQARGNFVNLLEYNDSVWLLGNNTQDPVTVGGVVDANQTKTLQKSENKALAEVLKLLTQKDYMEGHGAFTASNVALWQPTLTKIASDSSTKPVSMVCTPDSTTGDSMVSFTIQPRLLTGLQGAWVKIGRAHV